jgi:hypothetical protein
MWGACQAHAAWTGAAVNSLVQQGLEVVNNDRVHLSIAEFNL